MNSIGGQTYTVTVDRDARTFTVSAAGSFTFLFGTGTHSGNTAANSISFIASDTSAATSHAGTLEIGDSYEPQFKLQDYLDKANNQRLIEPSVNKSADGTIETVKFGTEQFYKMSFMFINNGLLDGSPFIYNATGLDDFNAFMQNIINKNTFEFMPDKDTRSTFDKVILESVSGSKKGTGYELKELTNRGLPGIYELKNIKLRVV